MPPLSLPLYETLSTCYNSTNSQLSLLVHDVSYVGQHFSMFGSSSTVSTVGQNVAQKNENFEDLSQPFSAKVIW